MLNVKKNNKKFVPLNKKFLKDFPLDFLHFHYTPVETDTIQINKFK